MPEHTPAGYPYPVPDDTIASLAATLQSLAEFLDAFGRIEHGQESFQVPGNGTATGAVEFDVPYNEPPIVLTSIANVNNPILFGTTAANVTATGFNLRIHRATTGTNLHHARWIAVGR